MIDLDALREEIDDWRRDRTWPARAVLLAFLVYVAVRHLADDDYQSLFGALNLGIHEGGHLLFGLFGTFLMVAGGTVAQLAAPIGAAVMFRRQRDFFAVAVAGAWLATNLYGVATYMADARELDLPLLTVGGGEAEHDWNYLLDALGLLAWDTRLAALVRLAAFCVMWLSIGAGAWLCWLMARPEASGE